MAINKLMQAALKALSYPDIDLKRYYKLARQVQNISQSPLIRFYKVWDHHVVRDGYEIPVRIFSPDDRLQSLPILLFFHGGGWVLGNIDNYDKACHDMARLTGHLVVSVDYRLAPEYPFPTGLLDCYHVAKEIFCDTTLLDQPADQITLIGDSAGANLAAAVSLMARDKGEFLPKRQILLYPATYNDHTEASPFQSVQENGKNYLLTSKRICEFMELYQSSPADRSNPYFAPLLAGDFSQQPDTLVLTAEYDPLRDEGEAYAHRLKEAGNYVEVYRLADALHGYLRLPVRYAHVRHSYEYINQFLKREVIPDEPV